MSDNITVNTTTTNIALSVFTQPNDINVNVVEAGAIWGSINGTITNQTDLVNYINNSGSVSPYKTADNGTSILPINGSNVITLSGTNSTISGGYSNTISGYNSIINGGSGNTICAGTYNGFNAIVGGQNNTTFSGYNSFIGSGAYNSACNNLVFIGSGAYNVVSGCYSNIVGGDNNLASGRYSNIVGGSSNVVSGNCSAILGGVSNTDNGYNNAFILGSNIAAVSANFTYVNNLSTPGSICAGTFYGDGSHLIGASLPGQAGINSLVQNTSGNWNTSYNIATAYSSVSSSFLTSIPQSLSGNWQSTYATVCALSSNWNTAYNIATAYSSISSSFLTNIPLSLSGNWQSTYATVCALSSNWQSAYSRVSANNLYLNANTTSLSALSTFLVVQTISAASYIGIVATGGGSGAYLPLSGGQLTGFVTSTSSISAANTITGFNIATNSQVQYLTGSNFVKVYQFYNSVTNSLDTVFN